MRTISALVILAIVSSAMSVKLLSQPMKLNAMTEDTFEQKKEEIQKSFASIIKQAAESDSENALSTVANLASIGASIAAFVLPENADAEVKNTANNVLSMIGSALSVAVKFLGEKKYAQSADALSTVANLGSIAASIAAFVLPENKSEAQHDYLHDAEEAAHYGMEAYHLYESLGEKKLSQDALSTVANLGSIAASIAAFVLPESKKDLSQDALSTIANVASIGASIAAFILPENKSSAQEPRWVVSRDFGRRGAQEPRSVISRDFGRRGAQEPRSVITRDFGRRGAQNALSTVANLASIGASIAAFVLPENRKKLGESEDALSTIANVASIGASIAAFVLPENKKEAQDLNSVLSLIGSGLSVAVKFLDQPKVDAQAMNKVTKTLAKTAESLPADKSVAQTKSGRCDSPSECCYFLPFC